MEIKIILFQKMQYGPCSEVWCCIDNIIKDKKHRQVNLERSIVRRGEKTNMRRMQELVFIGNHEFLLVMLLQS